MSHIYHYHIDIYISIFQQINYLEGYSIMTLKKNIYPANKNSKTCASKLKHSVSKVQTRRAREIGPAALASVYSATRECCCQ